MSPHALPLHWVERMFARFGAIWGQQKLAAMFPIEQHDEVKRVWSDQLGRFSGDTIGRAIQQQIDSGREWPPSLSEFVECCRLTAVARAQHSPAVMLPAPEINREATAAEREVAQQIVRTAKAKPGREWAEKLLARRDAGEQLSPAVVAMAQNALALQREAA